MGRKKSISSYLLNQTSTFTPSTGSRPFCTFNKFKQFSNWVKVYVKVLQQHGKYRHWSSVSELVNGRREISKRAQQWVLTELPNALLGKPWNVFHHGGGRWVDSFCLCCHFHCGRLLNLLYLGNDSSTNLPWKKQRSKACTALLYMWCQLLLQGYRGWVLVTPWAVAVGTSLTWSRGGWSVNWSPRPFHIN